MAIYHFSGTVISRSSGKSAIASAAYRSGEKLYDERQEKIADYSRKQDVVFKEVMLPEGAPEWMKDREKLWNTVEMGENRKDSQLAREFNFALPRELSFTQNIELAKEFVQKEFVDKGMVADLCIHDGKTKDGEEQPHAHVMLSMRKATEEGFEEKKDRSWNDRSHMPKWRESWADYANKHLAMHGIEQRIDHRTLEAQGIDLEAQKKIGPDNMRMERIRESRIEEHQRIAKENGDKILEDPNIALKAVTYHHSTFTHQDLARFINRHTIGADQFQLVYEKVKTSEQIIALDKLNSHQGLGLEGIERRQGTAERFTTKEMLDLESKMLVDAALLKSRAHIVPRSFDHELSNSTLSNVTGSQQKDALEHIIGSGDLKCLIGYAGTGKSYLLAQAREIWERDGYRVHGATLSGIAAENLEAASGIESRTLASRSYYWDKGEEKLTKKDILVIDEAGMLGSRQVARVLDEAKDGGAKVVLIGDPQQLQAIEAGAAFRAISKQVGFLELTEIRRQQEPWQQEATKEFASQNTKKALSLYEEHGCVHLLETQVDAKEALVKSWNDTRILQPDKSQIMLSYTRRDAQDLNEMARFLRKREGEFGEDQKLQTSSGSKEFAIGDRIYFLQNDRGLGVKNGTLGTIEHIEAIAIKSKAVEDVDKNVNKEVDVKNDVRNGAKNDIKHDMKQSSKTGVITVKLDIEGPKGDAEVIKFNLEQYGYITHGYAATIHKAQGVTVDESYVLASKHMDSHAAYVGMTRHRERADLFWSKEEFADKMDLERVLGRDRSKDITADYLVKEPRGISEKGVVQEIVHEQEGTDNKGFGENFEKSFEKSIETIETEVGKGIRLDDKIGNKIEDEKEEEKSVSELVEDLALLGEEHIGREDGVQKHIQELNEITQKASQDVDRIEYSKEIKDYLEEQDARQILDQNSGQNNANKRGSIDLEGDDQKNAAIIKGTRGIEETKETKEEKITPSIEEGKAQELIEKYYELEERHRLIKGEGGSKYDVVMAQGDVRRCSQEICKDEHAMTYLQKNDDDLFKKMDEMREREKVLEMQRNFELEL